MTESVENTPPAFEVAVAIRSSDDSRPHIPGYSEATEHRLRERASELIVKGDAAVKAATEALAKQIGETAQRIASQISAQTATPSASGHLGIESIEVSFGVTLTGGVQALFTAQAESSAQVTVTFSRSTS
jgi:hypothetical protein